MESAPKLFLHIASSMYGGMKRLERSLPGIESRTAESQLTKVVGELREVCSEQAKRLEEVFGSLDQRPSKEPSPAIGGFLEEEAMARRGRRARPCRAQGPAEDPRARRLPSARVRRLSGPLAGAVLRRQHRGTAMSGIRLKGRARRANRRRASVCPDVRLQFLRDAPGFDT